MKLYFCLILSGLLSSLLLATNDLELTILNPDFTAKPGQVLTSLVSIENNTDRPQVLKPFVNMPNEWQVFSDNQILELAPKTERSVLLSFQVAPTALAGQFEVSYLLKSLSEASLEQRAVISVTVNQVTNVQLEAITAPSYVQAGTSFRAEFVLRNFGNTKHTIQLTGFDCTLNTKETVAIAPQQSYTFEVEASTLAEVRSVSRKSIRVQATVLASEEIPINAYQHVTILPQASSQQTNLSHLPGYIEVAWLSRKNGANELEQRWQGTLALRGHLDKNKTKAFALKARGPNRFDDSTLGLNDEYYASLQTPQFSAFVGDKTYQLSLLTEYARYARGVDFVKKMEKMDVGLFYFRPRFFQETKEGYAFWTKYKLPKNQHLGFNFLKKISPLNRQESYLYSTELVLKPFPNIELEAEYAIGRASASGSALFLSLNTHPMPRLHVFSRWVYASKFYPGYFSDAAILSGSANYQLSKKINLLVAYNQDEANVARDTLFGQAPLTRNFQAGFSFNFTTQSRLKLQARMAALKDRHSDLRFNNEDRVLRLSYFQSFDKLDLSVNGEYGQSTNFLNEIDEQDATVFRSFLDATWRIGRQHRIRGFCQFFDQNSFSQLKEKQLIYGLSVNLQLSKKTALFFQYQSNYQLQEYYRDRNLLQLDLTQTVHHRHHLSFRARYALLHHTVNQKDWITSLQYRWNFGIPTKSATTKNEIYGRIISSGVDELGGIILQMNGQTVVTDERGHFQFEPMPAGEYYLLIDKRTLGVHRIVDVPLPMKVTVRADAPTKIVFGLIKGIKIYGKLDLSKIESKSTNAKQAKSIFSPLLLVISNGQETYRQMTDEFATFSFTDLQPGKWTMTIIKNPQHEHYAFTEEQFAIDLLPGGETQLTIQVLPKERAIQFQPSQTLSLEMEQE